MDTMDLLNNRDSNASLATLHSGHSEERRAMEKSAEILDVSGIRISPGYMIFANAYEGKSFHQKLEIQNCGKNLAFVKLNPPNSQAFQIKAFPKGRYLSPGLKIVRTVRFTFSTNSGVLRTLMSIYVNDICIDYIMFVTLSVPDISVEPDRLDFGKIDAVHAATSRKLVMWNRGHKGTLFSIDLGRNEMDIVVDPSKGSIPAKSKIVLRVELIGSREGSFTSEFWIKTTPLQRVIVFGTIISPKIVFQRHNDTFDFTMCNFSKTYYGASCTKPLMIQNESSSNSMFCIMAEIKGEIMPLVEAEKINDNYKNFSISPEEGRMYAQRGSIVQVTFSPWKAANPKHRKDYAACFLRILRMQCCDIDPGFFDESNAGTGSGDLTMRDSFVSKERRLSSTSNAPSINESLTRHLAIVDFGSKPESSLAICLHGIKQAAKVTIVPNEIILNDLHLFEVYDRVVCMKNESQSLPIIIKYVKGPSVEVQPQQFELRCNGTIEVTISIRPTKLGRVVTEVKFDLLYYNFPRSNDETLQIVGSAKVRIGYCATSMELKMEMTDGCKCDDIGKISQLIERSPYRRTADETKRRDINNARYQQYIDEMKAVTADKLRRAVLCDDYDLTNQKLLLAKHLKCGEQGDPLPLLEKTFSPFIPLMPKQLYNIKIYPKFIRLENQASHTVTSEQFTIENRNPFPVRIFFKSSKSCVGFGKNERVIIKGGAVRKIRFIFTSNSVGKYNITIFAVVNESHMFQVSATADVVPKSVRLKLKSYEFTQNDDSFTFLELENDLNAFVNFQWNVPASCFTIFPIEGEVPPKRTIVCALDCAVNPHSPDLVDALVTTEGGRSQALHITHNKLHNNVFFNTDAVDFETIPLNRTVIKYVTMTNLKCDPVFFNLENPTPIPGITIIPSDGIVTSKDAQIFQVVAHMKSAVKFSIKINVIVQNNKNCHITVSGLVEFPQIKMTPDVLLFRKVSPFSFDRMVFKVKNLSNLFETILSFPFDDYPELSVTESEVQHLPHLSTIILTPNESKILFLHFRPYHVTTAALILPFQLNHIIGPPDIHDAMTTQAFHFIEQYHYELSDFPGVTLNSDYIRYLPAVRVSFSATERIVSITNLDVRFVYFGEGHYANKTSADVEILNVSGDQLKMCIRRDSVAPPFTVSPKDTDTIEMTATDIAYLCTVEPNDKVVFSAGFSPEHLDDLSSAQRIELPIFIRNYQNDTIFNSIALEVSLDRPTIAPSPSMLYFEPSPIGVVNQNRLVLHVMNHFRHCEVTCENLHIPHLQISFPEGRQGCREGDSVPVVLSLCSTGPLCFKSKVTFSCTCRISCEVILKGAAENCMLTAHSLLHRIRKECRRQTSMRQTNLPSKESLSVASQYSSLETWGGDVNSNFINKNDQACFPFFPDDDDTSFVAEQKRTVLSSVEQWIYCQGFFTKRMYRIPESFTTFPEERHEINTERTRALWATTKKEPSNVITMPLVELILNLVGEHMRNSIVACPPASNSATDRLMYYYKTYQNALLYLENFDVYLPNVEAKYLLSYDKYLLYHKLNKADTETVFNLSDFNRYTKQCWMDLILQIIKVFFVLRNYRSKEILPADAAMSVMSLQEQVVGEHGEKLATSDTTAYSILLQEKHAKEPGGDENIGTVYHPHEQKLLLWLSHHYAVQRKNLWGSDSVPKAVFFFDSDLYDGLILAALTAAYCPYATSYIRDMYPDPYCPQQTFHNACRLVQTWKMLKLSFYIHPSRIVKPCMVEMLLLVSYLHEILPMYHPAKSFTIQAPLTKSNVVKIGLSNNGNTQVIYEAVFFGNEKGCFEIKHKSIKVPPHKTRMVAVTYSAKYVHEIHASLLLTGETSGQKYSKSFAYNLRGVPDGTFISQEIAIQTTIYKTSKLDVTLVSPFKTAATYNVFLAFNSLATMGELYDLEQVRNLVGSNVYRWSDHIDKFDEEGKCHVTFEISSITPGPSVFWLYFRNDEVGDFGVKATIVKKINDSNFESINVPIPKDFDLFRCSCKPRPDLNKQCPKILKVMIPSRNEILWDARKTTLLKYMSDDEKKQWKDSLDGPSCNRILKLILDSEAKLLPFFVIEEEQTFDVKLNKSTPFISDPSVTITDITSDQCVPLRIHATKNLCDREIMIRLESVVSKQSRATLPRLNDATEVRFYKLHFIELPSNPTKMQNFFIV